MEIHDAVLIAAAFCMFNRYVDGLATWQPHDEAMYALMGAHLAHEVIAIPQSALNAETPPSNAET